MRARFCSKKKIKERFYTNRDIGFHYPCFLLSRVSASSPVITLEYVGDKVLYLDSATTYYHDNGNSVTFYYSANVMGRVPNAIPIIINYGSISGSFTVNK